MPREERVGSERARMHSLGGGVPGERGGGVLSSFFTDAQDLSDFPCAFLFLNIPSPAGVFE